MIIIFAFFCLVVLTKAHHSVSLVFVYRAPLAFCVYFRFLFFIKRERLHLNEPPFSYSIVRAYANAHSSCGNAFHVVCVCVSTTTTVHIHHWQQFVHPTWWIHFHFVKRSWSIMCRLMVFAVVIHANIIGVDYYIRRNHSFLRFILLLVWASFHFYRQRQFVIRVSHSVSAFRCVDVSRCLVQIINVWRSFTKWIGIKFIIYS